jgi:hypothetical protein
LNRCQTTISIGRHGSNANHRNQKPKTHQKAIHQNHRHASLPCALVSFLIRFRRSAGMRLWANGGDKAFCASQPILLLPVVGFLCLCFSDVHSGRESMMKRKRQRRPIKRVKLIRGKTTKVLETKGFSRKRHGAYIEAHRRLHALTATTKPLSTDKIDLSWKLPKDVLIPSVGAMLHVQVGCELRTFIAALGE